jgi:hypothetical protein
LLAAGTNDPPASLVALGSLLIEAPAGAWDSMPAEEVGWNWTLMRAAAKEYSRFGVAPGGSASFMFRTHGTGGGLMQFLPASNSAPDVKIRYKLVQTAIDTPGRAVAGAISPTNDSIGWLRGTWVYDKEYSAQKTAELRAANSTPQKSFRDMAAGAQQLGTTNAGPGDISKMVGDMTATTLGMMNSMKDTLETQVILEMQTGTQMTFDETEVHSVSRLTAPEAVTLPYDEIKVINPTTLKIRWQGTNGGEYHLEGERLRVDIEGPSPFALFFRRVQRTNTMSPK